MEIDRLQESGRNKFTNPACLIAKIKYIGLQPLHLLSNVLPFFPNRNDVAYLCLRQTFLKLTGSLSGQFFKFLIERGFGIKSGLIHSFNNSDFFVRAL